MKTSRPPPFSPKQLQRIFRYNADTGHLLRVSTGKFGGGKTKAGYILVQAFGRQYTAHRLIWYMQTGEWPEIVDHINGDKQDNRIANLRASTKRLNGISFSQRKPPASGHRGVYRHPNTTKWQVKIARRHIGYFASLDEAIAAHAKAMQSIYGMFSPYAERDHAPLALQYRYKPARRKRLTAEIEAERVQRAHDRLIRHSIRTEGPNLTQTTAKAAVQYSPDTGHLVWAIGKRRGQRAGYTAPDGRKYIDIGRERYFAHRFIWFCMTGGCPSNMHIDHINGDHGDNRWCNLRLAYPFQNSANTKCRRDSKTGFKGVRYSNGLYQAYICVGGRSRYLGCSKKAEVAYEYYKQAALRLQGEYAHHRQEG